MTSRERVLRMLNHKIADRVPIQDALWPSTVRRWYKEGLPEDMSPEEYFNFEFSYCEADLSPRLPVKILEKNEEYVISTTPFGGKRKNHRDYSTTPEVIDWPIKTKEDWKEIKKLLKPDFKRVNWASGLEKNTTDYEAGKFVCFNAACGYDALQQYMHSEQLLIAMTEDPEWIREMVMTLAENIIIITELMLNNGYRIDGAYLFNDMGYKNALLFSPETYKKVIYDADRLLFAYFHSKGAKTILHSCGNVTELVPMLIEAGLDCLQPLEVKAGMDIIKLKEDYGDRLAFMGGIDTRLMADEDPSKIEEEIKNKFEIIKKGGGYIYHSDHSVPKNVSFQQYCNVMEIVKKYGVYPEYEAVKEEETAAISTTPDTDAKKTATAEVKPKRKLFGKREPAEKVQPSVTQESPSPTSTGEETKKKGFRLPFGKKK